MVEITKEWRKDPPVWVRKKRAPTLAELRDDFRRRQRNPETPTGRTADTIPAYCAEAGDLKTAIRRACRSKYPDGKTHNHQSRVPMAIRERYADLIEAQVDIETSGSFMALFWTLEDLAEITPGIGPVTTYDVAVRIGAYLKLEPEVVYLHAGVREGARALGLDVDGKPFLRMEKLPRALQKMKPDEVEDFLCSGREAFKLLKGKVR